MTRRSNTGRGYHLNHYFFYKHFACCASAATLTAFLQFPAFVCSCTPVWEALRPQQRTQIYIQWSKNPIPDAIDLFFYDTLGARKLDSYQQILPSAGEGPVYGLSGPGAKRLVALSGTVGSLPYWQEIDTYGNLCKLSFSLEREQPESPLLAGECLLEDGVSRLADLPLQTSLCAIRIRSVSCDFSDRPYANYPFRNNKLFLSYAGTECHPLNPGDGYPVSWINPGRLDSAAVRRLPRPEMVLQEGLGELGPERCYPPNLVFYCYANPARESSMGQPVTHLVLEGDIGPVHCYYPIPLPGLEAARCYQLDITLRRMGSPDPDIPTHSGSFLLEHQVLPWETYAPYTVLF